MILVFIGMPGSGKGTQARLFSEKHQFVHLSTGDLIRNEIDKNTEIGMSIHANVVKGEYVSDETILKLVESNLDSTKNFILDGFPRTLSQVQKLDKILAKLEQKIFAVINFVIDSDVVLKRLSGRFLCADCGLIYNRYFTPPKNDGICDSCNGHNFISRADDSKISVHKRLQVFNTMNHGIVEYYQHNNIVINVDSNQSSKIVSENICVQLRARGFDDA